MSFYGNITDVRPTHFQFDKIFNNRTEMDNELELGIDNIFAGRFVLVRYDEDNSYQGIVLNAYQLENNSALFIDKNCSRSYLYTDFTLVNDVDSNQWNNYYYKSKNREYYFKVPNQAYVEENIEEDFYTANNASNWSVCRNTVVQIRDEDNNLTNHFYLCTGGIDGQTATWEEILPDQFYSSYFANFQIDAATYNNNFDHRGYDGTVWQKVYSEGQGKFILVAHLNGVAPGFELFADAPSISPTIPYLDSQSTDSLYRIHVPSHWGFRVKEAGQNDISDQSVVQPRFIFDENTNECIRTENAPIDADIYFNKAGFSSSERHYVNDKPNQILITPTGESGKIYYDKLGNQVKTDMYELSIHLPVLGNTICDFYDKIYSPERKLDVSWNGDENSKTKDLNYVAGAINVLHDRLGQIILPKPNSIDMAEDGFIYTSTDGEGVIHYYRIGTDYEYEEVSINDINFTAAENINAENYQVNTYYLKDESNNSYYVADNAYDSYYDAIIEGYPTFYQKNITNIKFKEIDLISYQKNKYYYKNNNNYIIDVENSPSFKHVPYFSIEPDETKGITFNEKYDTNRFFVKTEDHNYIKSTTEEPDLSETYYLVQAGSRITTVLYQPNYYYYYREYESDGVGNYDFSKPIGLPILETSPTMVEAHKPYWYLPVEDTPTIAQQIEDNETNIVLVYSFDLENAIRYNGYPNIDPELIDIYTSQSISPEPDANGYVFDGFYVQAENGGYIYQTNVLDAGTEIKDWYPLYVKEINDYFITNKYYFKYNEDNCYYLEKSYSNFNPLKIYYNFEDLGIEELDPFYEKEEYYYYNSLRQAYELDTSPDIVEEHKPYYKNAPLYVMRDYTNRWPEGYEWKQQALFVPASVVLGTREETRAYFEMEGVDNGASSINGSILELQKKLDSFNEDSRDPSTINGTINNVNDLLYSVNNNLIPNKLLYVDDFGQINVTSISLSDLKTLITNVNTLQSNLSVLTNRVDTNEESIGIIEGNIETMQDDIDDILGQNALNYDSATDTYGLKTRVDTLENITINGYTDQGNTISGLVTKVGTLETNMSGVLSSNALNYNSTTGVYGLKDKVDALESAVGNNTGSDLTSRVGTLENTVNGYTDQNNNSIDGLVTKVNTIQTTLYTNDTNANPPVYGLRDTIYGNVTDNYTGLLDRVTTLENGNQNQGE